MSTTDLYQTELWADGMEVDFAKLNNMERFTRAMVADQLLQTLVGGVANTGIVFPEFGGQNGADPPTLWAYALTTGGAYLRLGSSGTKVQIAPGTLFQKIANSDGLGATFAPFTFDGSSANEFTIAPGDPTGPRVDLLQMQLQYVSTTPQSVDFQDAVSRSLTTVASTSVRRQLQCTLSVKRGTPNAIAPVFPDPDTGFVPVGAVTVGPGWTTGIEFGTAPGVTYNNHAFVHDLRMPVRVRAYKVEPTDFIILGGFALSESNTLAIASSSSNSMRVMCPVGPGRIVSVAVSGTGGVPSGATLGTAGDQGGLPYRATLNVTFPNSATANPFTFASLRPTMEGTPATRTAVTIAPSPVGKYSLPIWASGYTTAQPDLSGTTTTTVTWSDRAALSFDNVPNGTVIGAVTFYVAEGL